jgi:hypothetical protein
MSLFDSNIYIYSKSKRIRSALFQVPIDQFENKQPSITGGHKSQVQWKANISRKTHSFSLKLSRISND